MTCFNNKHLEEEKDGSPLSNGGFIMLCTTGITNISKLCIYFHYICVQEPKTTKNI